MLPTHRTRRAGFTLVELLVVIGIIAVLAGFLLTVRRRASNQALGVLCLNNIRQVGAALLQYAQNNENAFPFGAPADAPGGDRKEDWIHFRATEGDLPVKVNGSAIAPYIGAKGPGFVNVMRCPADDIQTHQTDGRAGYPYRFSFTMNIHMTSDRGPYWNRDATPRVTAITNPSQKILLAEENEKTINDGFWVPGVYSDRNNRNSIWSVTYDFLSVRHDNHKDEFTTPAGVLPAKDKRGNVFFVDGHAEFVTRKIAHSARSAMVRDEGNGTP